MDAIDRPLARQDRLVVQELSEEVLVYDLDRHRAHCLNRTAALIWRHCDGSTSVAEMARRLPQNEISFYGRSVRHRSFICSFVSSALVCSKAASTRAPQSSGFLVSRTPAARCRLRTTGLRSAAVMIASL